MKRLLSFVALVQCATFLLLGCGGERGPELAPVTGLVTLDGKPLAGALVTFVPQGETRGQGSFAHTDAAGKFELQTTDGQKGAVAGTYKVLVNKLVNPDGTDYVPTEEVSPMDSNAREILPPQYSSHERTRLTATIPSEGKMVKFELVSKLK
jgi:hypothetical protein